jgi:hypothetical protein
MGRLALQFANRPITFRVPHSMSAEMDVLPNQSGVVFPEAAFLINVDKPFEIHRMKVRLTAKKTNGEQQLVVMEPQPTTLEERVRLRVTDVSKNENLTKNATLVSMLKKDNEGTWEWEEPYTLVRAEGFQVIVDTLSFPTFCTPDESCEGVGPVTPEKVRVAVNFQGYLIVVAAPTETR